MRDLLALCHQLACGTSLQKRRAWKALVADSALWRCCQATLEHPHAAAIIPESYRLLQGPWDRSPLIGPAGGTEKSVREELEAASRVVAAASMAAVAREGAGWSVRWEEWSHRSVGLNVVRAAGCRHDDDPVEQVRSCYRRLAEVIPDRRAEIAQAQDAVLALLRNGSPEEDSSIRRVRVPILVSRGRSGSVCWLWLERVDHGFGTFFQSMGSQLGPLDDELHWSLQQAWGCARALCPVPPGTDVRWRFSGVPTDLEGVPVPLAGSSLQAATTAGLILLLDGREYNPSCAISATVREDCSLGGVEGIAGEGNPKLRAARALRPPGGHATVIVSRDNSLTEAEHAEWMGQGVRVLAAPTLADALPLVTHRSPGPPPHLDRRLRVMLLYQPGVHPDEELAGAIEAQLVTHGCDVMVDRQPKGGLAWAERITRQVQQADAVIPLLSESSSRSEALGFLLQLANDTCQDGARVRLLPVRVNYEGALIEPLATLVEPVRVFRWHEASDDQAVLHDLMQAVRHLPCSAGEAHRASPPPPTGVIPLDSRFYVERGTDQEFLTAVARQDSIVRVKGARQMGKTSLLARGLQQARARDARVVLTDFQRLSASCMGSPEALFRAIARAMAKDLQLEVDPDRLWDPLQGPNSNFREFMLTEVLSPDPRPLIWGLDEADRLFGCDFASEVFGLFRSWHNERALNPTLPWSRLTMAIAYATEAHLFLTDLNQSPFNVGTRVSLDDFSLEQIVDLNARYASPLRTGAEAVRVHRLTGGHPYLTHRALHEMATRDLDLGRVEASAERDDGLFDDHLRRLLMMLASEPELCQAVRGLVRGKRGLQSEVFFRLRSGGVVVGEAPEDAAMRCELYRRYLERHLQ